MKFTEIRAFTRKANALFSIFLLLAGFSLVVNEPVQAKRRAHTSVSSRRSHSPRRLKMRIRRRPPSVVVKRVVSGANDMMGRGDLERAYSLYDQSIGDRLSGNTDAALKNMIASYDVYHDYHGVNGALEPMLLFDLARTAEEAGNLTLARDTYQKCLRLKPGFSEACISLAGLLVREGNHALAIVHAKRLAETRPNDPRASMLLAMLLKKTGLQEEAKQEELRARRMMESGSFDRESETRQEQTQAPSQTQTPPAEEKPAPKVEPDSANTGKLVPNPEREGSPE